MRMPEGTESGHTTDMDVYLFGAGASAAEGAPATSAFLASAHKLLDPTRDPRVAAVWRFLEWLTGQRLNGQGMEGENWFRRAPAIDQLFSLVDWSLATGQALGPGYAPPGLRQLRRDLEHLVALTLQASLPGGCQRRSGLGPHQRFAQQLVGPERLRPFALISLNYDTLLDDGLRAAGAPVVYGLDDGRVQGAAPTLVKLHGSLNWAQCSHCGHLFSTDGGVAHLLPDRSLLACARCGSQNLDGVLISPTLLSHPLPPQLQTLWDWACLYLSRAERIIFVGYSLPPTDVAVLHLILRAILCRPASQRPSIEVINHSDRIVDHFQRLFGPDVRFDLSGFQGQMCSR